MKSTIIAIIVLIVIIVAVVLLTKKQMPAQPDLFQSAPATQTMQDPITNQPAPTTMETTEQTMYQVEMSTTKGVITLELDGSKTPKTVANFVKLANEGFYDGTRFHRVIEGFMIQGGDPQSKDTAKRSYWGTGSPGYKFDDELSGKETYAQGTLAMANSGPNTNGSQFFIVTANPAPLPPAYTVFGKVVKGMDVALAIEKVDTASNDQPIEDVIVTSVKVLEK